MSTKKPLENLLTLHHAAAYQWARQCCRYQSEWAQDVLQSVYVKVLEGKAKPSRLEPEGFKSWLFGVIRLTALEQWRKERDYEPLEPLMQVLKDEEEVQPAQYYQQMIGRLPERQAQLLTLVFYHGLTVEAAAGVMEIAVGTARTHYARGKATLKELIESEEYASTGPRSAH